MCLNYPAKKCFNYLFLQLRHAYKNTEEHTNFNIVVESTFKYTQPGNRLLFLPFAA